MANEELYPTGDDFVHNPLREDLDGGGFKIFDLDELDLTGTGAITGVNTINGLPYPPEYWSTLARPLTFNFPVSATLLGDGTDRPIFTIYDNVTQPALQALFIDPGIRVILLTMPVNITKTDSGTFDQGIMDFRLYINGAASATQNSGQYIITPYYASSPNPVPPPAETTEMMNSVTLFFFLVNGVDYASPAGIEVVPLRIMLYGRGGYNFNYAFNLNSLHPGDSQPTVCNAVGFH